MPFQSTKDLQINNIFTTQRSIKSGKGVTEGKWRWNGSSIYLFYIIWYKMWFVHIIDLGFLL